MKRPRFFSKLINETKNIPHDRNCSEASDLKIDVPSNAVIIFEELYNRVKTEFPVCLKHLGSSTVPSAQKTISPFPVVLLSTVYGSIPSSYKSKVDQDIITDRNNDLFRILRLNTGSDDFVLARFSDLRCYISNLVRSINNSTTSTSYTSGRMKEFLEFFLFLSSKYRTMDSITITDISSSWCQWGELEKVFCPELQISVVSNTAMNTHSSADKKYNGVIHTKSVSNLLKDLLELGLLINRMDIRAASESVKAYWFGMPQSSLLVKRTIESRLQLTRILSGRIYKEYDKANFLKKYPRIKGVDSEVLILDALGSGLISTTNVLGHSVIRLK